MKKRTLTASLLALALSASLVPPALAAEPADNAYPRKFDLRSYGVVTPVKQQGPWGSCWAFGGIAAAESSILTMMDMTNAEYKAQYGEDFDLSEKHLVWFATHPVTAASNESQAGEGLMPVKEGGPNAVFDGGGLSIYITTLFASGTGPVFEKSFPYRGAAGRTEIDVYRNDPAGAKETERSTMEEKMEMTLEEAVAQLQEQPEMAKEWFAKLYVNKYLDESIPAGQLTVEQILDASYRFKLDQLEKTNGGCYSSQDDWTIPELDESGHPNRDYYAGFTLVDGNQLPELCIRDPEGKWQGINDAGMWAAKSELLQGRGVTIAFKADQSLPGQDGTRYGYINQETWAHYTFEDGNINHGVCIVGWDDNYPKERFNSDHQPPADGAWLVKNSWGSQNEYVTLPDGTTIGNKDWGVVDENGNHTGYFYISYYDRSLKSPESMAFGTDLATETGMGVWMYDYMPATMPGFTTKDKNVIKTANVFKNDSGETVKLYAVSTKTASQRTRVTYTLYKLNDNAQNPEDGQLLDKKVAYYEYAGFHRLSLRGDVTLAPNETLAVVVEETGVDHSGQKLYEYTVNTAFSHMLSSMFNGNYYGKSVVNHGESFLFQNGTWKDLADCKLPLTEEMRADLVNMGMEDREDEFFVSDNFSIKAYVVLADQ